MLFRLILLFTLVPLAELWLLIYISRYMTIPGTLGIVLFTGFAGAALARHQGWQTWRRLQEELRGGRVPADALLDGLMIFTAGVLMITPGVLTDAVGFALLLPPVRRLLKLMEPYRGAQREASWVEGLCIADRGRVLASWELRGGTGVIAEAPNDAPAIPGFWAFSVWNFPQFGRTYNQLTAVELESIEDHWTSLRRLVRRYFHSHFVSTNR